MLQQKRLLFVKPLMAFVAGMNMIIEPLAKVGYFCKRLLGEFQQIYYKSMEC
jgi:hypothetical protein